MKTLKLALWLGMMTWTLLTAAAVLLLWCGSKNDIALAAVASMGSFLTLFGLSMATAVDRILSKD